MDGSSANWNVLEKFDEHLFEKGHKKTINIESCFLHIEQEQQRRAGE